MANIHKSLVGEVASNKPNAATAFNLPDTPATGFLFSFDTAYASGQTLPYTAKSSTAYESGIGTFTAGAPDTLARTTVLDSSTGSAIDWSAGGDVTVFTEFNAGLGQKADRVITEADAGAHLTNQSDTITIANLTGVVGKLHLCTIAGLTASRDFVLPTGAAGDRIGVHIVDGDASFELLIKPSATGTINAGTVGAEWSRLFIKGESVILRCTAADTWIVEKDGRISMVGHIELTTAVTTNAANTIVYASANGGVWTMRIDVGNVIDAATEKFTARRSSNINFSVGMSSNSTITDGNHVSAVVEVDNTTLIQVPRNFAAVTGLVVGQLAAAGVKLNAGSFIRHKFRTQEANKGMAASTQCFLFASEVLP